MQFLDWLKGTGWQPVSLDDLSAAARGERRLPAKAILLTFDDGFRSLYTRVFPLLKAYHYPAVAALVGAWMEDTPDDTVQEGDKDTVLYGDKRVPRTNFISWDEAREMQKSGLVEFASHSYDLHRGVQANPQGSMVPSAVTWRYDPLTRTYEDDARYVARIRDDLSRSRLIMQANLGSPPRAVVWPYGRYTGLDREVAKELGFSFGMTLEPEPAYTSDLFGIHRYFPSGDPTLGDIVANLRFEPARSHQVRVACVTLDAHRRRRQLSAARRGARPNHRRSPQARNQYRHHRRQRGHCRRPEDRSARCILPLAASADPHGHPGSGNVADPHARRRRHLSAPSARRRNQGGWCRQCTPPLCRDDPLCPSRGRRNRPAAAVRQYGDRRGSAGDRPRPAGRYRRQRLERPGATGPYELSRGRRQSVRGSA